MDYLVGTVINNRYEILEKVGTGGMATVYKAKCKVLDRFVAVKVLRESLKNDMEVVRKFNTESRAAARLSHPNIVQVYDVSETGDIDYIVMEYVDGITLKEYITKKGHLETEEACDYAAQIGRALVCAHANGIIHRDIKPHNVLMASDGTVKVADFGIAQASTSETMVAGGGAMGSVHYLSPEQARGGFTNERSDVYSLGVVLYEMLTGEVPFDGANPVSIALAKLENDPEDIRTKCAHYIPDSVCHIVMKAISKDQHSRYQTAADMVADLEKVMGIAQTKKADDSVKFETKRLSGGTKEAYNMRKRKPNQRKKKKSNAGLIVAIVIAMLLLTAGLYWMISPFFAPTPEVKVPSVIGYSQEEAEDILKKSGLKLDEHIEFEESDTIPAGLVMEQTPEAGETVKEGRPIKITISTGPKGEDAEVPKVVDLDEAEAERQILRHGFECVIVKEINEDVEIGKVIRQEPEANAIAKKGTEVTIYVSGSDEETEVPDVMGKSREDAEKILKDAGFEIGEVTEGEDDSKRGTVISQTPTAKTLADKGTKIDLQLSKGPMTTSIEVVIPDGDDPDEVVTVKVLASGKEIHNGKHKRSDKLYVSIPNEKEVEVKVYINDELKGTKTYEYGKPKKEKK